MLQEGHTAVPNLVLKHYAELGITPTEMMFIIHIWQYWWTERQPFPSLNTVSKRMNLSRRQARNYTQSLKGKGFLEVHDRFSATLGQMSSEYDFTPLLKAIVACAMSHDTSEQEVIQTPRKNPSEGGGKNPSEAPRNQGSYEEDSRMKKTKSEKDLDNSNIRNVESVRKKQGGATRNGESGDGPEGVGEILARSHGEHSVQRGARAGAALRPEAEDEDFQRIQSFIMDRQRELGDRATAKSSSTRAWNLYQAADCSIARFEEALYKARSLTQESTAQIKAVGDDPNFDVRRKIKMPYFFAVLEDILGLRQAPEKPSATPRPSSKPASKARQSGGEGHGIVPHIET